MAKFLFPYNQYSQGAKALADAMGIRRIKSEGSRFHGAANKTVINWGNTKIPDFITENGTRIINSPSKVALTSNKLLFFRHAHMNGCAGIIPAFTTDQRAAQTWLNSGRAVVVRKLLSASGARGLEIVDPGEDLPVAPLYTIYEKKKDEYRVHIFKDQIIDIQRKGIRQELANQEDVNWRVRNLENGFVFVRNDGRDAPHVVKEFSLQVFEVFGLDFGAVDITYNERTGCAYVLEINTAPGLVGSTVDSYARVLNEV